MCPVLARILDVDRDIILDSRAKVRNIAIDKEQGGIVQLTHIALQRAHGAQRETRELSVTVLCVEVEPSVASLWVEHAVGKRGMDDTDDAEVGFRDLENGVEGLDGQRAADVAYILKACGGMLWWNVKSYRNALVVNCVHRPERHSNAISF